MADYRVRDRLLLVEVEGASGTAETPTAADNAVLVENPQPSPNFEVLQTNEAGSSLDGRGPIVGGGNFAFSGDVYLKGAGAAGEAPEYGPILRAAAMAETLTAADETDTAQAGAASTITLAAGESSTDDAYKGMVIEITSGTGSGQSPRVISAYNGTSKVATVIPAWDTEPDNTSVYAIRANALYVPASSSLETVTAWLYDNAAASGVDSLLRKIHGAAATFEGTVTTRGLGRLSATLTGILTELPSNVSRPTGVAFDDVRPRPFIDAEAYLGGSAIKFRELSFNIGNTVQQADDPGALYGFDVAGVTTRTVTGQINPQLGLLSSRNSFSDFVNGNEKSLWINWGPGNANAGHNVSMFFPAIRYTGANPADVEGYNAEDLPFESTGFDSGLFLCLW